MFPDRRLAWCALALAALVPFLSGLRHDWTYDDHGVIVENAFLGDPSAWPRLLTLDTLRDATVVDGQRPLVVVSYLVDRTVWGVDPAGFRATNLLLHLLAVMLAFGLFLQFTEERTAFTAAMLFALHPLAVEPVVSPAFREDLLYMVFGLAYLLTCWSERPSATRTALGLAALAASILSKEAAVVLPFLAMAGWVLLPAVRPSRKLMAVQAVLSLLVSVVLLLVIAAGRPVQAVGGAWNGLSFRGLEGVWTAPWLALKWLGTLLWPYPMSVDYVVDPVRAWTDPRCWISLFVLAALVVTLYRRGSPVMRLALAWLLVLFAPVSNVVPLYNPFADRYAYGMLPGFTLLLAAVAARSTGRARWLLVVLAAGWCAMTMARVPEWKVDRTLWTEALAVEPRSARAHTWLGLLEKGEGRLEAAWDHFYAAEQLNPHDPVARINRAILLGEGGDLDGAETLLREVLFVRPGHPAALRNLELCLALKSNRMENAETPSVDSGIRD